MPILGPIWIRVSHWAPLNESHTHPCLSKPGGLPGLKTETADPAPRTSMSLISTAKTQQFQLFYLLLELAPYIQTAYSYGFFSMLDIILWLPIPPSQTLFLSIFSPYSFTIFLFSQHQNLIYYQDQLNCYSQLSLTGYYHNSFHVHSFVVISRIHSCFLFVCLIFYVPITNLALNFLTKNYKTHHRTVSYHYFVICF